ncbi:MAG TPA: presenilin family intramembrane aspartyl protease PSH [Thermoplasmata archaeon]|jgi:presenilin-like A22 family membrane protease|nr:presenilin family intramembrane aspartyl protease PSH [Thermoplasmata archaeon]
MRSLRWLGLLGLFIGAQVVGLLLAQPFRSEGFTSTSNPQSPTAPLFILVVIVVAPLFILLIARRRGGLVALRHLILIGIAGALYFTLYATFSLLPPGVILLQPYAAEATLDPALALAATVSAALYLALLMEPQWYVVDLVGFLAAGSLIALLGISFAILPAFILLTALMVYDAIAVYRTKHMVSLADVVTDMKLPILMVMPDSADYDYTRAPRLAEQRTQPAEERSALFMGLGDVVIPGTLIVSAFIWLPTSPAFLGLGANLWAAVGALLGALVGYGVLMRLVLRGNPQAGLPLLNGGALLGYALVYIALFHSWTLGLTGAL